MDNIEFTDPKQLFRDDISRSLTRIKEVGSIQKHFNFHPTKNFKV